MKKFRIVQITPSYYPLVDGVENVTKNIAERFVRCGCDVYVITSSRDYDGNRVGPSKGELNGVSIYRMPSLLNYKTGSIMKGLLKVIKKINPDVIHTHVYRHPHTITALQAGKEIDAKVILHSHSPFLPLSVIGTIQKIYYKFFDTMVAPKSLPMYDVIIALTHHDKNELIKRGAPTRKIVVIPNAVEDKYFDNNENPCLFLKKHHLKGELILYLGAIHPDKNIEILIRALPSIFCHREDVTAVIAGYMLDVRYAKGLRMLTRRLNIENRVVFLGKLSEEEKLQAYKAAKVYILPSFYEPFGITLLEAMASGRPVVAMENGGPKYIVVHGKTGLLARPGDYTSLGKMVLRIISDDSLAKRYGENARTHARNYSWEETFKKISEFYNKITF